MCGIAGIVSLDGKPVRNARQRIASMIGYLQHRGPDRQGVYVSPDGLVAFGNTRLAVVDVKTDFAVPMVSADGGAALTYNGEIFNYRAERARHQERGVALTTHSDTEVMLEGLRRAGADYLTRLDGFWGFGFYDVAERQVLIGRDLMGERHVFYWMGQGELIFASEVNPVLAMIPGSIGFDVGSVVSAFQFRAAPPERTLLEGIRRLEAGCGLVVKAGGGSADLVRLQHLRPERHFEFFARKPGESAVLERFEDALQQACASRVPTDVDFVSTLSGGLDSTLVALFASDYGRRQIKTLIALSTEAPPRRRPDLDELGASRFTASKLGTDHTVFSMLGDDCLSLYRQAAENAFDGTFCEGLVNYHQLAREVAAQGAKVILLSDGGDDFMGGYDKDRSALTLSAYFHRHPTRAQAMRHGVQSAAGRARLPERSRNDLVNWSFLSEDPFRFRPVHGGTTPDVMERLFPRALSAPADWRFGVIADRYRELVPTLDLSQRIALSYATTSVPDHFNLRTDRGAMLSSIESRLPMLAPALVELMIATPDEWRFKGGGAGKYIFRKLIERHIGPEISSRAKYGFAQPAWKIPRLARKLDFESTIRDSDVFTRLPFLAGARDFFLRPEEGRHRWFAYCLAAVNERIKSRVFDIEGSGRRQVPVHAVS